MTKIALLLLLAAFAAADSALAGDSLTVGNPAITNSARVNGSACANNYEVGVAANGQTLICYGGTWKNVGSTGYVRVTALHIRTAADNYTTKVLIATCPAGKRVIGGDCNFDGGTNMHKNPLGHTDGTTGFWCFFSFANAYDPANPGFGETSSADCIDQ